MHNASVTGKEGPAANMKLMSQPHQLESATASPELPFGPSQEDGSQLEQTNENFQSSGSSQIHRMTLKYSDEDEFMDLATAAYNFVPNVTSKEAPFFLMFGRDPYMPLNQLISQARRYLGNDEGIPNLEALQNLLQMTTAQIEYAATRRNQSFKLVKPHDFKVGDLVLVRNHMSKAFQEKYQDSFHVVWLLGKNQLEVKDQKGHIRQVHITDVKKTTMLEVITNAIPDYTAFGHAVKLQLNPNKVEDLQWTIPEKVSNVQVDETSIEGETTPNKQVKVSLMTHLNQSLLGSGP